MTSETRYYEDVDVGDDIGPIERAIDHGQVVEFVKAWTNDTKPTRFNDPETAMKEGLAGPIVPGVMTMAFISRLLTEWAPGVSLNTLDVVFRQLVQHDVVHTLSGIVTDKGMIEGRSEVQCDVFLADPEGTRLIIGKAILELPSREG